MSSLLQPERAARLVEQHALDSSLPGLTEVIETVLDTAFDPVASNGYEAEIQRAIQRVVVDRLVRLASVAPMAQVRAIAAYFLEELAERSEDSAGLPGVAAIEARAHDDALRRDIRRFLERPGGTTTPREPPTAPPGSPIGDPGFHWLHQPYCSEQILHTGW